MKKITYNIFNSNEELRILHLSDFHLDTKYFNIEKTIKEIKIKLKETNPNFIIFNGDLLNDYYKCSSEIMKYIYQLDKLNKKIYFVYGNHESQIKNIKLLDMIIKRSENIETLNNKVITILLNKKKINILGIINSSFNPNIEKINKLLLNDNIIMFVHNPKDIDNFNIKTNIKLIFSGHTHAGQIVPIGNWYLKKQKITKIKGEYLFDNKIPHYISNGIGYGKFILRFLAKPEFELLIIK